MSVALSQSAWQLSQGGFHFCIGLFARLRIVPVQITVVVNAGWQLIGKVNVPQTAGYAQAEMMLGNGLRRQEAANTHIFAIPRAAQVAGINGEKSCFGHWEVLSLNSAELYFPMEVTGWLGRADARPSGLLSGKITRS